MSKIFLPESNVYNKCFVVQSQGVIRAYDRVPQYNQNYNYRDYYIESDYIFRDNYGSWSSYSNLPVCLSENDITHEIYYRVDFYQILIILLIMSIFIFYIPIKIFKRLFRRFI